MNNIYAGTQAEILSIRKHTSTEWSVLINTDIKGAPGQFAMLSLPSIGEVPISISGFHDDALEFTIRSAGKVTSCICQISPGDFIDIRGPYGKGFPLNEFADEHLLIIAGGTAIAPVKPLIEYYLAANENQVKTLDIIVGFKSPKHVLFRDELNSWKKKCDVRVTVDADEDYAWEGSTGFVVEYIKDIKGLAENTKVIIIGPPLMMKNSVRELMQYEVQEENIYLSFERHMKCGVGKCGHCRIRDKYVCLDGPVFNYVEVKELLD